MKKKGRGGWRSASIGLVAFPPRDSRILLASLATLLLLAACLGPASSLALEGRSAPLGVQNCAVFHAIGAVREGRTPGKASADRCREERDGACRDRTPASEAGCGYDFRRAHEYDGHETEAENVPLIGVDGSRTSQEIGPAGARHGYDANPKRIASITVTPNGGLPVASQYAEQRWHDASTGRFLSEDPVGPGGRLMTPTDINPRGYARGNPMR